MHIQKHGHPSQTFRHSSNLEALRPDLEVVRGVTLTSSCVMEELKKKRRSVSQTIQLVSYLQNTKLRVSSYLFSWFNKEMGVYGNAAQSSALRFRIPRDHPRPYSMHLVTASFRQTSPSRRSPGIARSQKHPSFRQHYTV